MPESMPAWKTDGARLVSPRVWWVGCGNWRKLTGTLSCEGSCNVFLIGAEGEYALLDAAIPAGVEAVLANCRSAGAEARSIRRIVLTHSHWDHAAGAAELRRRTGAAIAATDLLARTVAGDASVARTIFGKTAPDFEVFTVDEVLGEGDKVSLGPYKFTTLLTPGHIPDALCLLGDVEGRRVLVSGDTVIGDQGDRLGVVGWLDGHWNSNPRQLLKSIGRLIECEAEILLPGHGLPIIGRSRVRESLQHCADRMRRFLASGADDSMLPLDWGE